MRFDVWYEVTIVELNDIQTLIMTYRQMVDDRVKFTLRKFTWFLIREDNLIEFHSWSK